MNIRKYDPVKDLPILEKWFKEWDWAMWDKDAISPFSYFVEHNGEPVVFSGYYRTIGTNMAEMSFTIGDITAERKIRKEATDLVINYIFSECEEIGVRYLYYSTDTESMIRKFEEKGAIIAHPGNAWTCCKTFGVKTVEFLSDD